jgi:CoA:oxalate CoA-transferase
LAAGNDGLFQRLCQALGRPDLAADARFRSNSERLQNIDALRAALETVLSSAPGAHWIQVLEDAGIPCSLINTVADAVEHPQIQARNMIVQAGDLRMAGNPIKFSTFLDPPTREPAPELDADGDKIRNKLRQQ